MEKKKYEVGCYFDGAFGHYYNSCRIIRFAEELGWVWREPVELPSETPGDEFEYEYLVDTVDEIEEWLTDNTIHEENEYWCWSDGDFGLWAYCKECSEQINKGEGCIIC